MFYNCAAHNFKKVSVVYSNKHQIEQEGESERRREREICTTNDGHWLGLEPAQGAST